MNKTFVLILSVILAGAVAFGQTAPAVEAQPQRVVVEIQQTQKAPPAPAAPAATAVQKTSEWVDLGTNVGTALGSALKGVVKETKDTAFGEGVSVVQGVDNFSKTDAGRFTMLVIGWKVMGKDALDLLRRFTGVAVGIPIQIVLICLAAWVTRRFWMVRSVVTSVKGPFWSKERAVTYQVVNDDVEDDTRYTGLFMTWLAFALLSIANISWVIL